MFSGKPNFSLRNKKIIRRRSISGATSSAYGTSQTGIFQKKLTPPFTTSQINGSSTNSSRPQSGSSNKPNDTNSTNTPLFISRPVSTSSLAPLPSNGGVVTIKIDLNEFSDGDPMISVPITNYSTCKQILTIIIKRIIELNSNYSKRDANLFCLSSVSSNGETRDLSDDVRPLIILQQPSINITNFRLSTRPGSAIKVYTNSVLHCEYKTLIIDQRTRCSEVLLLILNTLRIAEDINRFFLELFSPNLGVRSNKSQIDQNDYALAVLRDAGSGYCFLLTQIPKKKSRFSTSRAGLNRSSSDTHRDDDSLSDDEMVSPSEIVNPSQEFLSKDTTVTTSVTSRQELEVTTSIVSLSGLSYESVDAESDNSFLPAKSSLPAKTDTINNNTNLTAQTDTTNLLTKSDKYQRTTITIPPPISTTPTPSPLTTLKMNNLLNQDAQETNKPREKKIMLLRRVESLPKKNKFSNNSDNEYSPNISKKHNILRSVKNTFTHKKISTSYSCPKGTMVTRDDITPNSATNTSSSPLREQFFTPPDKPPPHPITQLQNSNSGNETISPAHRVKSDFSPFLKLPPPPPIDTRHPKDFNNTAKSLGMTYEQDSGIHTAQEASEIKNNTTSQVSLISEVSTTPSFSQHSTGFIRKPHKTHRHHKLNINDTKFSSNSSSLVGSNPDLTGEAISIFKLVKNYKIFTVEVTNSGQGLGMSLLDSRNGYITVQSVVANGVIQIEGSVQPGDILIEVNEKIVLGVSKRVVCELIRSSIGSIRLVFSRYNTDSPQTGSQLDEQLSTVSVRSFEMTASHNYIEELDRLNRVLNVSRPVVAQLKLKNNTLTQQINEYRESTAKLTASCEQVKNELNTYEEECTALASGVSGLTITGTLKLNSSNKIQALESVRDEISHLCDETQLRINTLNDELKASLEESEYNKTQSESANKELNAMRFEVDKMKNEIELQKNAINGLQGAACIDCRVKDKDIKNLKEKLDNYSEMTSKKNTNDKCEFCIEKEIQINKLEDQVTEITILVTEQETKLQKIHTKSRLI